MNMQHTLQHLFNKSSLEEVPLSALKDLVRQHPYFATGHFLLAKKMEQQGDKNFIKQLQKTTLYFHDPLLTDHLLKENRENSTVAVDERGEVAVAEKTTEKAKEDALLFEPYHTIDYFASVGIKLNQDPHPDDKLGNQLKSFTEWLKTLRRLPEAVIEETIGSDESHPPSKGQPSPAKVGSEARGGFEGAGDFSHVEEIAAHSLEEREVVTEAMAEVLLLQGKKEKALAVYDKLSLLNPDKSAYFADRIEQLKAL